MPHTPQESDELVLKNPHYYVTVFKVKGHKTWRAHLAGLPDGFDKQKQHNHPVVTDLKVIRIDRMTGEVVGEAA